MTYDFIDDPVVSSNPFLDLLMKYIKSLTFRCVVKDEYEANQKESKKSLNLSTIYLACIENDVSLGMFTDCEYIEIPDEILEAVLPPSIIQKYKNFGKDIDIIPKDDYYEYDSLKDKLIDPATGEEKDLEYTEKKETFYQKQVDGSYKFVTTTRQIPVYPHHYRRELCNRLRIWFLNTYEEENDYYRMICGLPSKDAWGVPMRDIEGQFDLPSYFEYEGIFLHEIGLENIQELDRLGILDVVKMQYPNEKYLDYILCGIDLYEARKKADFHILYLPDDIENSDIISEFDTKYRERREFLTQTIYNSALELESSYYHKTMIVFLLITVVLDMIAELQTHIVKKDILDRRCVEFIFEMYAVPYYKNIPYKYQAKICNNLHNLIKYKSCTQDMLNLANIFSFENIKIYKYYLLKLRKYDNNGDIILTGKRKLVSNDNTILMHESLEEIVDEYQIRPPLPPNYIETVPEEEFVEEEEPILEYNEADSDTELSYTVHKFDTSSIDLSIADGAISSDTTLWTERFITYPFDYYREKGNKLLVVIGGRILTEGTEYQIYDYNCIRIKTDILETSDTINYEFFYNKLTIEDNQNLEDIVQTLEIRTIKLSNERNYHDIDLTQDFVFYDTYLYLKDKLAVSIGSEWLSNDQFSIDYNDYKLHINEDIDVVNKDIYVIFFYSKFLDARFQKIKSKIYNYNDTTYAIPEPFPFYISNGNTFYLTVGTEYIEDTNYTVTKSSDYRKSTITFNDPSILEGYDDICFNFAYSAGSFINRLYLKQQWVTITADRNYQLEFRTQFPVENYIGSGYKIYVKYNGSWLNPSTNFSCLNNNTIILDDSLALLRGQSIEVLFIYCDKDRTDLKYKSIGLLKQAIPVIANRQEVFDIDPPLNNYDVKYNQIIVDISGRYLKPDQYYIDYISKTLTVLNYADAPLMGSVLNITYIFNKNDGYTLHYKLQKIPAKEVLDNNKITLLSTYNQSDQDYIISLGSTLVPKDSIYLINSNELMINDVPGLIIQELKIPDYKLTDEAMENLYFSILFVYSTYVNPSTDSADEIIMHKIEERIHYTDPKIIVPEPAVDYIANGWPYYVTYRVTEKRPHPLSDNYEIEESYDVYLDEQKYDVVASTFYTNPVAEILDDEKYNGVMSFVFVYIIKDGYIYYDFLEDFDNDVQLEFCRVPIDNDHLTESLMDTSNWRDYDGMTYADGWWDGQNYRENNHELLKHQIFNQTFNYSRTKYYTISQMLDFNKYANQTSLFYSMWYDDLFAEDKLKLKVNPLSSKYEFNVSHLFLYILCLTYLYNGQEPVILEHPSDILAATGFNFRANIEELKQFIRDNLHDPNDFLIINNMRLLEDGYDIETLNEFLDIFDNNLDIREYIARKLVNVTTIQEYRIWKHLYDSLMTWEFNTKFFNITERNADGTTTTRPAVTYNEFLQFKSPVLYQCLMEVQSIVDNDTRTDVITSQIDDICYALESYFESVSYIFADFQGRSFMYLASYMMQMIEFFKSYKIQFQDPTSVLNLNVGYESEDNSYVIYEDIKINEIDYYKDYVAQIPHVQLTDHAYFSDSYEMKEDFEIIEHKEEPEVIEE